MVNQFVGNSAVTRTGISGYFIDYAQAKGSAKFDKAMLRYNAFQDIVPFKWNIDVLYDYRKVTTALVHHQINYIYICWDKGNQTINN